MANIPNNVEPLKRDPNEAFRLMMESLVDYAMFYA
jgi:hypothetical protein